MHTFSKLLFVLVFACTQAWGMTGEAYLRVDGELTLQQVELEDLVSETDFTGKYFTIFKGSSKEPVRFDEEAELVKRASHVYYHLTKARNYFNLLKTVPGYKHEKSISIRIEQTKRYDEYFHFNMDDNEADEKGLLVGALTIPADKHGVDEDHSWGDEIWFYKKTEFKVPSKMSKISAGLSGPMLKNTLRKSLIQSEFNTWLGETGQILRLKGLPHGKVMAYNTISHISSMLLPLGILEAVPLLLSLGKNHKKELFMDTAYIPEIIYHEYSHFALKNVFDLNKNSALSEAYPNYFAYKISGETKIGKAKEFTNVSPRNAKSGTVYGLREEQSAYATYGSFTFSMLYQAEKTLGSEGPMILLNSLNYIDSHSDLRRDLPAALMNSVDELSQEKDVQKVKLMKALRDKGL